MRFYIFYFVKLKRNKLLKDYYEILGLKRTASKNDIKKAFFKLIRKYHPDVHNSNPLLMRKFYDLVEAYKVLGDLDNRLKYSLELNKKIKLPKYLIIDKDNNAKKF